MRHAVAAWLFSRPIVGDGPVGDGSPCAWGWTRIDDACFKMTPGMAESWWSCWPCEGEMVNPLDFFEAISKARIVDDHNSLVLPWRFFSWKIRIDGWWCMTMYEGWSPKNVTPNFEWLLSSQAWLTRGSQSFDSSKAVCASMHQNATVASIVNEDFRSEKKTRHGTGVVNMTTGDPSRVNLSRVEHGRCPKSLVSPVIFWGRRPPISPTTPTVWKPVNGRWVEPCWDAEIWVNPNWKVESPWFHSEKTLWRIKIRQHRRCCHLPHGLDMWPLGWQKNLGTKITTNRSPWRAKVADRSWLDGVQCGYFQDFVEVSASNCTRCKLRSNEILGDFVSCKFSNHLKHIS